MFAFEGLGQHLLAHGCQAAGRGRRKLIARRSKSGAPAEMVAGLRAAYYDIRRGLGFTKTPEMFGAFPTDPYSHSPRHLGAQQPGMTGQVKEEILTRWAELGIRVDQGALTFAPRLLRRREFFTEPQEFGYVDANGGGEGLAVAGGKSGFTYCQVPICYRLADTASITIEESAAGARNRRRTAIVPRGQPGNIFPHRERSSG